MFGWYDLEAMGRLVHDFYHEKYPPLDLLVLAAKEKELFGGEHVMCGELCIRWALSIYMYVQED